MWSAACNLIPPEMHNLWVVDPQTVFSRKAKWDLNMLLKSWFEFASVVGFVDASWKEDSNGVKRAGIGGFLLDHSRRVSFLFSGPSKKNSSHEVECEALEFLLENILKKKFAPMQMVIFSDARKMVLNAMSCSQDQDLNHTVLGYIHKAHHCQLQHISRELNWVADQLAKKGSMRTKLISGWPVTHQQNYT